MLTTILSYISQENSTRYRIDPCVRVIMLLQFAHSIWQHCWNSWNSFIIWCI